ncbi:MAG: translation initiation factor IF-2, partial [SAR324 cluster bacterium]|nr:translation initiation factor IF-2 [SAR324 cluster bacterium]
PKYKKEKKPHLFNARKKDLVIGETIFVGELASLIGIKAGQIIKTLMNLGIMVTVNESVDAETAQLVAAEYEVEVRVEIKSVEDTLDIAEDKSEDIVVKAPVVTIMGHVDHGKTSLLDKIRSANVTDGEAGGITQHIGAYNVVLEDGSKICFLDTPGHEAFTAMRARGANATDIVILVVAADDGPRPQTIEAINHSKAAGVPIIVAINKCDKDGATPDKVVQQLMEHELISEDFGGDIPMVQVSAHSGLGIDKLLEAIHLQAEIMELTANPTRTAEGVVIESRLDKGRGNICTVLVQNGTLKIGDCYVVGQEFGRVRAMWDDKGNSLKVAPPSTPVEVVGLNGLPFAGDTFQVGVDEKTVRQIAEARTNKAKAKVQASEVVVTLENIFEIASAAEKTNLNLIIKADVVGSMEALSASLQKLGNDEVSVKVIHSAVGGITQTDIALAHASQAIVIGFNVRPDGQAKKNAKNDQVDIKLYSIIYECIEDVTQALEGLLQPIVREEIQGKAEVLEVFTIPKVGVIAGTKIVEGKFMRDSPVRVFRDDVLIYEGQLASLQRFKDSVKEVATGFECGIGIQSYKDLKAKDILESYQRIETAAKL